MCFYDSMPWALKVCPTAVLNNCRFFIESTPFIIVESAEHVRELYPDVLYVAKVEQACQPCHFCHVAPGPFLTHSRPRCKTDFVRRISVDDEAIHEST